jgi:ArsR family transcriptional regulator, arsenate/arsenite/antimonite-responsive transcriptional repressor / arsenate reductase (thioredoxin)
MYSGPLLAIETSNRGPSPPAFLRLAGHPVRWRLLSELASSDRRVGELCARLELPQNLVSYHLGRLRAERVVSRRRSSADRRDGYYVLELDRCGELLARTGLALHPGLRLGLLRTAADAPRSGQRPWRLLFLCTGNSARSQIAQALAEQLGGAAIEALSAGSHPKPLHPNAVRVMHERGIDIAGRRSKHLDEFSGERFDHVISLCDRVREVCPEFPGHPELIHWSIPDPARTGSTDAETYPAFRATADELVTRVPFLLELIEHARQSGPRDER